MANVSSSIFLQKLDLLRADPTAIQRMILRTVSDITNGEIVLVDPTTPFSLLMECTATISANTVLRNEYLDRRSHPDNAATFEDVYLHMSDNDFLDRFAQPSRTTFTLLLSVDEVIQKAVPLNDGSGVKLLKLPKHSEFLAGGLIFTSQYATDIRVFPNGGITVLYDTDVASPILTLGTNQVDWGIQSIPEKYMRIALPLQQMSISSQILALNAITGFSRDYAFNDQFYYCRVYTKNAVDADWVEIRTTHTDQVYDTRYPTALLKVLGNVLRIQIPQIYFTSNLIKDSLRLDIYTTKGAVEQNLSNVDARSFYAKWIDRDTPVLSQYSAPLSSLNAITIFSDQDVTGGTNGIGFEELRERVVTKTLSKNEVPLTPATVRSQLNDAGYELVLNLDNITDRQYIATRTLPNPAVTTDKETETLTASTAIGCAMQMLQTNLINLVQSSAVTNNGERATITPDALFVNENGIIRVLTDVEREALVGQVDTTPEALVNLVNAKDYLYTPFYYVLDVGDNSFEARAYRLDNPSVISKYFKAANNSLLVDVSSKAQAIIMAANKRGYRILVELTASDALKEFELERISLQLSYLPAYLSQRVFVNGTLITPVDTDTGRPVNNRYIYEFLIETNFDVDKNHYLIHEPYQTPLDLTTEFDLVCMLRDHMPAGTTASEIDTLIKPSVLPNYIGSSLYKGVSWEKLKLRFGNHLDKLWCRTRSVIDSLEYERFATDIPAVYSKTVYEKDSTGNVIQHWNPSTQELEFTVLHAAGDPVLVDGTPVMAHYAGDFVLDANGDPIPVGGVRGMLRQLDLLLLDGKYYFASNETTQAYKTGAVDLLSEWILNDLDGYADRLLERSELFFHPKRTFGSVEVYTNDKQLVRIKAEQTFNVTCYVEESVIDNKPIKRTIERTIARTLNEALKKSTISSTDLVTALKDALKTDVISFALSGFTEGLYDIVTLKDASVRPSVGKRLAVLSNRTLAVQDAINISFVPHR